MENRLVGRWYREEQGETLNIFDETPLRMKMSFSSSGHYHFEPNCVYEQDGYLCYEINDETYRMVYRVRPVADRLEGHYTQFGKETPVVYRRVSAEPEDLPYRYQPTEIFVPETGEPRLDLLRRYAAYEPDDGAVLCATTYRLGGSPPAVLARYAYASYLRDTEPDTDARAFRLLDFVCDHFGHNGSSALGSRRGMADIITFCEGHDGKVNCRGLAILLASLLRLNGIRARHITCMPYEEPFYDCHVVVDCQLPSGARVILDPTWRLWLRDAAGAYVSLERLRELLIQGEPVFENDTASYNGTGFDRAYYREYMTKNTFRFSRGTLCADGCDEAADRRVELIPKGYPTACFDAARRSEFVLDPSAFWAM